MSFPQKLEKRAQTRQFAADRGRRILAKPRGKVSTHKEGVKVTNFWLATKPLYRKAKKISKVGKVRARRVHGGPPTSREKLPKPGNLVFHA